MELISNENFKKLTKLFYKAEKIVNSDVISWSEKYDLFFPGISRKVSSIICIDYYDPDTSYEDDVLAYFSAFKEIFEKYQDLNLFK
jgi:hypothetical protein